MEVNRGIGILTGISILLSRRRQYTASCSCCDLFLHSFRSQRTGRAPQGLCRNQKAMICPISKRSLRHPSLNSPPSSRLVSPSLPSLPGWQRQSLYLPQHASKQAPRQVALRHALLPPSATKKAECQNQVSQDCLKSRTGRTGCLFLYEVQISARKPPKATLDLAALRALYCNFFADNFVFTDHKKL